MLIDYGLMTLTLVSVALAVALVVALAVGWGWHVVQAVQVGAEKQDLQHLHSQLEVADAGLVVAIIDYPLG